MVGRGQPKGRGQPGDRERKLMKKLFYALVIGGIAYAALVFSGMEGVLPEGRLRRIVEIPGAAIWRMEVGGMDLKVLIGAAGAVLLVLLAIYTFMAR